MTTEVSTVLSRLKRVKGSGPWTALCPAHDDGMASLSVSQSRDGKVLVHCHAGCEFDQVIGALGLEAKDLFPDSGGSSGSTEIARYDYTDEKGKLLYSAVRFIPKDFRQQAADGSWSMKGVRRVLYRLPEVMRAVAAGEPIFVVEGEKDVDALRKLGFTATTNVAGAGKWSREYSQALKGAVVVIVPDNDEPGRKHAEDVAKSLDGLARRVVTLELPGLKPKGDVSDWLAEGGSAEALKQLLANSANSDQLREEESLTESEMLVVGQAIIDSANIPQFTRYLSAGDLASPALQAVWAELSEMHASGETIDTITLDERMKKKHPGRYESWGGVRFLAELVDVGGYGHKSALAHAKRVQQNARVRHFALTLEASHNKLKKGEDPEVVWSRLQEDLTRMGGAFDAEERDDDMGALAMQFAAQIEATEPRGLEWPWPEMTKVVGRLIPGRLWAVVGFPGSGKSAFLRNVALSLVKRDVPVAYFAVEEAGTDVLGLMCCIEGGVSYVRLGFGEVMTEEEQLKLVTAMNTVCTNRALKLNYRKFWNPEQLLARIRLYAQESKTRTDKPLVVIIDHAHLVSYPGASQNERDNRIGQFAEDLTKLSQQEDFIPIVAYQPRKSDSDDIHRPVNFMEIRGTGRIAAIAANVLSPFRPWVEVDETTGRTRHDVSGQPIIVHASDSKSTKVKKPGDKGTQLARDHFFIQPSKRRIGGYNTHPIALRFDGITGRIS